MRGHGRSPAFDEQFDTAGRTSKASAGGILMRRPFLGARLRHCLLPASLVLLVGCEEAWRIGATNHCAGAVEATATDAAAEKDPPYRVVAPGASVELREVPKGVAYVYIGVRHPGDTSSALQRVNTADLTVASKGAKSDFYFEITECPT